MIIPYSTPRKHTETTNHPHGKTLEERVSPRQVLSQPIEFLNMGDDPRVPFHQDFVSATTVNLSDGGLKVRTTYDVHEGTELGVIVRKNEKMQVFLARVVWKIRETDHVLYGLCSNRIPLGCFTS